MKSLLVLSVVTASVLTTLSAKPPVDIVNPSQKHQPTEMTEAQERALAEAQAHRTSVLSGMMSGLNNPKAIQALEKAKSHWYQGETSTTAKKAPNDNKGQGKNKDTDSEDDSNTNPSIMDTFGVGYGGASAYKFENQEGTGSVWMSMVDLALDPNIGNNSYYQTIKNFQPEKFNALQQSLTNSKYLIYWLPKNWDESWFSVRQIQLAMDSGYTPVFMYWYFGDHLVHGMPTQTELDAYAVNNQKVVNFLNQLSGQKMVIMEPEFNKSQIVATEASQKEFASIIGNAIDNIEQNSNDEILFSLCMTDAGNRGEDSTYASCGYDNCALGDQYSWSKPEIVYSELLNKIDFVSFQQMVAQFSRDPLNPGTWTEPNPKAYSESELGINHLAQRISNFSEFLNTKYDKPVFLPYMTIPTATWNDANANGKIDANELDLAGWELKASQVYENLAGMHEELQTNGMFAYAPMALFDNPSHDKGGYQYFMNNEYHLGIMKTGAQDGIDTALHGDIYDKENSLNFIYEQ
jgi:hypothetical protein